MAKNTTLQNLGTGLRLPALLLLAGQVLYIAATLLHAGGDANNHRSIFEIYAHDQIWTAVHLGQFAAMAVLLGGLLSLFAVLDTPDGRSSSLYQCGRAATIAAFVLYGVLQAVDGVALKQVVEAWNSAPVTEKAARFASAEAVRWLEWGVRSYHDFALCLALLAGAFSVSRLRHWVPGLAMHLSAAAYFAQGWLAGSEGFSAAQSNAIVIGWACNLVWMLWLLVMSFRSTSRIISVET